MKRIEEDGRVWNIITIELRTTHIAADYISWSPSEAAIGPTGRWVLFEIRHGSGAFLYRGRWDEKQTACDIDKITLGVDGKETVSKRFKGHWTNQPDKNLRVYEIDIQDGNTRVFTGEVSFRLVRRMSLTAGVKIGVTTDVSVTRVKKSWWSRLRHFLRGKIRRRL